VKYEHGTTLIVITNDHSRFDVEDLYLVIPPSAGFGDGEDRTWLRKYNSDANHFKFGDEGWIRTVAVNKYLVDITTLSDKELFHLKMTGRLPDDYYR